MRDVICDPVICDPAHGLRSVRAGEIGPVRREIVFEPLHEQPPPREQPAPAETPGVTPEKEPVTQPS